jgi:hypothetical protein
MIGSGIELRYYMKIVELTGAGSINNMLSIMTSREIAYWMAELKLRSHEQATRQQQAKAERDLRA